MPDLPQTRAASCGVDCQVHHTRGVMRCSVICRQLRWDEIAAAQLPEGEREGEVA